MNKIAKKIRNTCYNLFFKKKKKKKNNSKNRKQAEDRQIVKKTPKPEYDISGLREKVSQTEYINNLRVGRSWILPQMLYMGFRDHKKKQKINKEFSLNDFNASLLGRYNNSPEGRRNVWDLISRNYNEISKSGGLSKRARWWTPKVVEDIMEWDFKLCGKASRGFISRRKCKDILNSIPDISNPDEISKLVILYNQNRMKKRPALYHHRLPKSFINAFKGDGAYNAMMTMVKIYGVYFKDDDGVQLNRDQCIDIINQRAEHLSGQRLLEFCKEKFFDSKAFDYKKYLKK